MNVWLYTIGSVVFVSLLSLSGVLTLSLNEDRLKRMLLYLVSFAIGGLYGDAFLHIIPEAYRTMGIQAAPSLCIIGGIFLFFVIEKTIRWSQDAVDAGGSGLHPLVPIMISVDAAHNFIDGLLIGASYAVSVPMGLATTLAVVLHEIPHEIGDFAVLVHGGLPVRKALLFNFLTALTSVLGGVVSLWLGSSLSGYSEVVLPVTAGGFIYIAGSDLLPELQKDLRLTSSFWQFVCLAAGTGLMALMLLVG